MKKSTHYCDCCGIKITNDNKGMIKGSFAPPTAGYNFDRSEFYNLDYLDVHGKRPDLCKKCMIKELTAFINQNNGKAEPPTRK